nr:hypothetical protein REQ54_04756 [Rhizobium sp. Q54]
MAVGMICAVVETATGPIALATRCGRGSVTTMLNVGECETISAAATALAVAIEIGTAMITALAATLTVA